MTLRPMCNPYFRALKCGLRFAAARETNKMPETSDPRLYHAHVARNRVPTPRRAQARAAGLRALWSKSRAAAASMPLSSPSALPGISWQPTDFDANALASIAAHRAAAGAPNLLPPLRLDTTAEQWPVAHADAVVCNNMIHISPWAVTEGLMRGASRVLRSGGILFLYGPYKIDGRHTAPSNEDFDASLRARNVNGVFAILAT